MKTPIGMVSKSRFSVKPDLGIPDAFLTGYVTQGVRMVHQIEPEAMKQTSRLDVHSAGHWRGFDQP